MGRPPWSSGSDLYVVQIATNGLLSPPPPMGSVVKVKAGGSAPSDHEIVRDGLLVPYGIAINGKHAYVTTGSVLPGAGEVLKIRL